MVGYRGIGNMEQHLVNATSATLLHKPRDLWKSPRGTVLRIEALAMVAIILSFFLAFFGSCRRWSNRWIVQKGVSAAHVLSLSLGTYSIGLMQSSSVKSEMYPIWAVSLLALSGCIDQVTSYSGLDYKGPLSKMIFQLCLYCGYVLLMSFSTISGVLGKSAICILSVVTFIKGFHRSLALVLPSRTRESFGYSYEVESAGAIHPVLDLKLGEGRLCLQLRKGPQVGRELLWGSGNSKSSVPLHDDVKTSVADFLGKIKSRKIGKEWVSLFADNGVPTYLLPYSRRSKSTETTEFTRYVLVWHIATCYCEVAEQEGTNISGGDREMQEKNRRVAKDLSRYFVYLMVSAPELLRRPVGETKTMFNAVVNEDGLRIGGGGLHAAMASEQTTIMGEVTAISAPTFDLGVYFGKLLCNKTEPPSGCTRRRSDDPWKLLALLWVQTLLYAAPYGDVEVHRQRLSQGGEFITHLWALLYHLGIDSWEHKKDTKQQQQQQQQQQQHQQEEEDDDEEEDEEEEEEEE
nr:unnamed protein product [Digitaria exilis]